MKYVVLEALERLARYEDVIGREVLKPTFLFVQKYGRSAEEVLQETAAAFGKKKSVFLRKAKEGKESSLLELFHVEAQKAAGVGKDFDGFVLAELTGEENEKERTLFYEHIKAHASEITCMFTVKDEGVAGMLQKELEQQFPFVRTVHEECYNPAEQKEILMKALEQGGASLTEQAKEQVEDVLKKTEWKTTDHVENKLRNLANNLIYEQIMEGKAAKWIGKEEITAALEGLTEKREKFPIGFAITTVAREQDKESPEMDRKELIA